MATHLAEPATRLVAVLMLVLTNLMPYEQTPNLTMVDESFDFDRM